MDKKNCDPIDWKNYFKHQIFIEENKLPIYYTGEEGPNLICLHGAGHSALSFSLLAEMSKNFRVISFDFRGHGFNTIQPENDLSIETLISETEKVLLEINRLFPDETMIILGHSLGGAIATKAVCHILKSEFNKDLYDKIQGVIIIDVIEGSAMEALPFMMNVVNKRENNFDSINSAIYYMSHTQIRNLESCRISIPPLLKEAVNEKGEKVYQWKTDLVSSEKYWPNWYKNLSYDFLSIRTPKALILTDTNELDTPLTIGHMEGKFKLVVIKGTGHFIQEDDPKALIENIQDFINVFKIPRKMEDIHLIQSKLGNQVKIQKYIEFKG